MLGSGRRDDADGHCRGQRDATGANGDHHRGAVTGGAGRQRDADLVIDQRDVVHGVGRLDRHEAGFGQSGHHCTVADDNVCIELRGRGRLSLELRNSDGNHPSGNGRVSVAGLCGSEASG